MSSLARTVSPAGIPALPRSVAVFQTAAQRLDREEVNGTIPHPERATLISAQCKWLAGWKQADNALAEESMDAQPRNYVVRLVQHDHELGFLQTDFPDGADIYVAMECRGYAFLGGAGNMRLRTEIRDMPTFSGLHGPMFDGFAADGRPIVRYEDASANKVLSA